MDQLHSTESRLPHVLASCCERDQLPDGSALQTKERALPTEQIRLEEVLVNAPVTNKSYFSALRRTILLSGLAVCDQALFAGTSFAFTVLLARWTTDAEFGAFSVAFSVFVLLQNIFEGLIFEPFGVFGAGRHAHRLDAYTGRIVIGHIVVAGVLALVAGSVALVMVACHQQLLACAFLGMALACPFLLGRILSRQPLYISRRIHWSVVIGALYFVISVVTLMILQHFSLVTAFSAFLALGLGSLVASLTVMIGLLKPQWRTRDPELSVRRVVSDHIGYGRWAIGDRLLSWFQGNIFFLALPAFLDLHASATFRALTTLAMPAYMTVMAVCAAALPEVVRLQTARGHEHTTDWLLPAVVAGAMAYCLLLSVFGQQAAHLAFAGRYDADMSVALLMVVGLGTVLSATASAMEVKLRARQMVRTILMARIFTTVFLLIVGLFLILKYQILGAAMALPLTWALSAGIYLLVDLCSRSAMPSLSSALSGK